MQDLASTYHKLTKKQQQIVVMISNDLCTKDIAIVLEIERVTVWNHRKAILRKTGFRSMIHLIATYFRAGYLK